ncbi:hypothetical protein [Aquimarina spongiae]|uniref:Uncharacterized protein n=1 Tax=Aquimarina spongiae TaxID=570521 RepID=A0A1M6E374_9FLAO|nr:hypothetical protein [Aquimarina spongiae]SHI79830.1 hypothetical protein SAMN04488508_103181 [Aquimarina spongiae]
MKYKDLITTYCVGMLLWLPWIFHAQDVRTFKGELELQKYKGEASYSYLLKDTDTILNGPFTFNRSNLKALLEKEDVSFSIQGQFTNNYPEGNWSFRFNEFQSSDNNAVEDYRYVVNVDGNQRVASGNLLQGRPDGTWTIKVQQIKDSEVRQVDFNSVITFEKGVPQQSFRIEDQQQELVGRFLRNGLAHDKWTLFSDRELDEIESWYFDEGVLQTIEANSRNGSRSIPVFKDLNTRTEVISLGEKYMKILEFLLSDSDARKVREGGITYLLTTNEGHYQNIDDILSALGSSSFSPEFKVVVPFYPLASNEKEAIDTTVAYYQKSRSISDFLLNDSQLNIRKLSDQDVRSLEDEVAAITENILQPLQRVDEYHKDDILTHIEKDKIIANLWENGISQLQDFEKYKISLKGKINPEDNVFKVLKIISEQTFYRLEEIQATLQSKIDKQVKQQEAIALEKEMVTRHNYLEELGERGRADSIPTLFFEAIDQLKNTAEDKLKAYSEIENLEKKLEFGRTLVHCFEDYGKIGERVLKLPEQQKEIHEKYMDAVWNPFIATLMDEMVKKRIVSAYDDVLIPYFLEEINDGLACEEAKSWMNMVDLTYKQLLILRDEDTRKMERKLKKEKDPIVVLQRFKVPVVTNQD